MGISVIMLVLAGFFIGGTYSFWKGGHRVAAVVVALIAVVCLIAAGLWYQSS